MLMLEKTKQVAKLVVKEVVRRVDPAERAFRRVWPSIDSVDGLLVSPIQENWLFRTARSLPNGSTIVEIGSFKGRSTCCLAYGCKSSDKHVFAIDTFSGNDSDFQSGKCFERPFLDEFKSNIERCGLTPYVTAIPGWSSEVAKTWDKDIHLLFIDGSHVYEDALADFRNFYPHVVSGGIVAFHDVTTPVNGQAVGHPGSYKVWHNIAGPLLTDIGNCSTLGFGRKPFAS